jgi:hypothetical protein
MGQASNIPWFAASSSTVDVIGGTLLGQQLISSNQALALEASFSFLCDASAGPLTLTLANGSSDGQQFRARKIDDSENAVCIKVSGSEKTLDQGTFVALKKRFDTIDLEFHNGIWMLA